MSEATNRWINSLLMFDDTYEKETKAWNIPAYGILIMMSTVGICYQIMIFDSEHGAVLGLKFL